MAWIEKSAYMDANTSQSAVALFTEIHHQFGTDSHSFFKQVLTDRLKVFHARYPDMANETIAYQINSLAFQHSLRSHPSHWPTLWSKLEHSALSLFNNWAEAWCYFLLWKLMRKYNQLSSESIETETVDQFQPLLSLDEQTYQDELVDDVQSSMQLYYTLHYSKPVTLPDAIMMINLSTFVLQQRWYEVLNHLELSACGTHFLLTAKPSGSDYPILVSSARVNPHHTAYEWLYFSPFFQTSQWSTSTSQQPLRVLQERKLLNSTKNIDNSNVKHLDTWLWQNMSNQQACCEIIRLTVSGTTAQKLFYLYLSQKRLMQRLVERSLQLAFVVIEQPLMIQFYASLPNDAFCPLVYNHISGSENPTHKGLWVIPRLNEELTRCDFKRYKSLAFTQMKQRSQKQQGVNHA